MATRDNFEDVLTPAEVVLYLRCDRRLVYALVHSGALPAAKVSRTCWRISRQAVHAYLGGGYVPDLTPARA
jgi:excisionase family DNA binding protein